MRRKLRQGLLLLAATLVGLLAPQAGAATIIDDFSLVSQYVDLDRNTATDPDNPYSFETVGNLFGSRELYVALGDNRNSVSLDVSGSIAVNNSTLGSAPGLIADSIAHITWDGVDSTGDPTAVNYNVGPVFDFTGSTAFEIDALGDDDAATLISIQVWDFFGNTHSADLSIPINTGATYSLAFSAFDGYGIQWDKIGAIRMHFLSDDIALDNFRTNGTLTPTVVPVPAAAGLGVLGMAVVAGFRRRSSASVA